ncbi:ABC transporter permease [Tyzzerella sp. OttesenSCG-928-J15]|nr:ABC transporter permease [Tyzzerella sp. OttesenSCG-928-J15]
MANQKQAQAAQANSEVQNPRKERSQWAEVWHRLKKNKGAMVGLAVVILLGIFALGADIIWDYDTQVIGQNTKERLQHPNSAHIMGTDEFGRDIFYRVMYGTKYSLSVGFVAVAIAIVIGVALGAVAGYFGGVLEEVIMRGTDIFAAVPNMLMAIVIVSALGQGMFNLMVAIGITSVPQFVRITRAAVLTVRNQEYVEACRAIGLSKTKIIFSHILPNCLSPIIVQATLRVGSAIISSSSLSFLGLGIPAPSPEWGSMLSAGRRFIRDYNYMTLFPGLAIMVTVLALNLLGDGLRDALDPKLKD